MVLQGNTKNLPLQNICQTLALNQQEGILSVSHQRIERHIGLRPTGISLLCERPHASQVLQAITTRLKLITADQYENVFNTSSPASPGDTLVTRHVITPQVVLDVIREQLIEYLYEVFEWPDANYRFEVREIPDDRCIFTGDLGRKLELSVNSVLMEVVRREDEWRRIREEIPSPHQIYRNQSGQFDLEDLAFKSGVPIERIGTIIGLLDGERTLEEVTEASRFPPFHVFNALRALLEKGCIRPLQVEEKKALAERLRQRYQIDRLILVLYSILDEAPDQTEVRKKLVMHLERKSAPPAELADHYWVLGQQLFAVGDMAGSQEFLAKVLEQNPKHLDAIEVLARIHAHAKREKQLLQVLGNYSTLAKKFGQHSRGAAFLLELKDSLPSAGHAFLEAANLYRLGGDRASALQNFESAARYFQATRDFDRLTAIVEKIAECDERSGARWRKLLMAKARERRGGGSRVRIAATLFVVCLLAGFGIYEGKARVTYASVLDNARSKALAGDLDDARRLLDEFKSHHPYSIVGSGVAEDGAELARVARKAAIDRIPPAATPGASTDFAGDAEAFVTKGMTLRQAGSYAGALAHFQARSLEQLPEEARRTAQREIQFLARYLKDAQNIASQARTAAGRADLESAHALLSKLLAEYEHSPAAQEVRLPVRIETQPRNAALICSNSTIVPIDRVLWLDPDASPTITVSAPGFASLEVAIDPKRSAHVRVSLQKESLWTQLLPSLVEAEPCIAGDELLLANRQAEIVCMVVPTGATRWTHEIEGLVDCLGGVRLHGDSVVFSAADSSLYQLERTSGAKSHRLPLSGMTRIALSQVDAEGRVFLVTTTGKVIGIHLGERRVIWERAIGGLGDFPPVSLGDSVAVVARSGRLSVLRAEDGEPLWIRDLGGPVAARVEVCGDRLVVGLLDGRVVALTARDGSETWQKQCDAAITKRMRSVGGTQLLVLTKRGTRLALRREDGAQLWEQRSPGDYVEGLATAGTLGFVIDDHGMLRAFSLADGIESWQYDARSRPSCPLVAEDELLLVAGEDRQLHAIPLHTK